MSHAGITAAEGFLTRLGQHGVNYLFANSGTDFAPLIEAYEGADEAQLARWPKPLTITHETVAVGMAHGAYLASGQLQAVMVHVNVGLANSLMGLINAQSDNIPILMFAGRTPITEYKRLGSRMTPIQYGQEMRDQASMLRNVVKWDYELRYGEQIIDAVDRAVSIATSTPSGPVFLGLPREPLAEAIDDGRNADYPMPPQNQENLHDKAAIDQLAKHVSAAKFPLLICQRGDHNGRVGRAIERLCAAYPIGVIEPFVIRNNLASDHSNHLGYQTKGLLDKADCIIVVDSPVPWIPRFGAPRADCHIAHIGDDPLFSNLPMRSFPASQHISGAPHLALELLADYLSQMQPKSSSCLPDLKQARAEKLATMTNGLPARGVITPDHVAAALAAYMDKRTIVFSELGPSPDLARPQHANQWFTPPYSGGLGWGVPAALGARLTSPEKRVIACVGDGSYIFANPVACNQVMASLGLPVLVIVMNNQSWNATRRAAHNMYPDGAAAKNDNPVLTDLSPSPKFTAIASASGGWAESVDDAANLEEMLARAIDVVETENRAATLEIRVSKRDGF
jgi:acetolactate synthase-1/2/3 large subunit